MILRVFPPDARSFGDWQHIGILPDVLSGKVTEKRNEDFKLEFEYPSGGRNTELIVPGNIVLSTANDTDGFQPFRITDIKSTMPGKISVSAAHLALWIASGGAISTLNKSGTAAEIIATIAANKTGGGGVSLSTNISGSYSYNNRTPKSLFSAIVGSEGSFVDVVGGATLHFHDLSIDVLRNRGADRGVEARYGINLVSLDAEDNLNNYATHILPYWADETSVVYVSNFAAQRVIALTTDSSLPQKIEVADFSSNFDSAPTAAALREKALSWAEKNLVQTPVQTISAEFVPLWYTEEYKHRIPAQTISIDDEITVVHPGINLRSKSNVVALEWDIMRQQYTSVQTGRVRRTIIDTIRTIQKGVRK